MEIGHLVTYFPKTSETFILDRISCSFKATDDVKVFSYYHGKNEIEHQEMDKYNLNQRTEYIGKKITSNLIEIIKTLIDNPVENFQLGRNIGFQNERDWLKAILLKQELENNNFPNLMHAHFASNGEICASVKKTTQTDFKLITSLYGTSFRNVRNPDNISTLIKETDKFIVISKKQRKKLTKFGVESSKIHLIPNGVDTDKFKPKKDSNKGKIQILTVARLAPEKDLKKALKSIKELNSKAERDFIYKIVGSGAKRGELERFADNNNISNVKFLGSKRRDEVADIMSNSHIFLLTSKEETLPTVLMEAHCSGLPVVSTNVGSINEIIKDGESGFLQNTPHQISDKLKTLMEDKSLRRSMGKKGRDRIKRKYSKEVNNQKITQLYRDILHNHR